MVDKANNRKQRKVKRTTNTVDPGEIANNTYNQISGGYKQLEVGARLIPKGVIGTSANSFGAGNGKIIEVFNSNTTTVRYFLSGDDSIDAPSAITGIAVPPLSYKKFAMGADTHLRADHATELVFYEVDDDTQLVARSPAN